MLNPLEMKGRTVLVTGASSGIGRETSILLSKLGARVILVARNLERLERTHQQLEGVGHAIETFDLSLYDTIPEWMLELAKIHGPLDGLVHGAGFQMTAPLNTLEAEKVRAMWRINVSAGFWLAKGYRQPRVSKPGGSLLFLASTSGIIGAAALSAYSGSKGAVIALTRSLAIELARDRIRVNCLAPGIIRTEMFDDFSQQIPPENITALEKEHILGFGEPLDVANAAIFLLSPASRWITGAVMVVDGGLTAH